MPESSSPYSQYFGKGQEGERIIADFNGQRITAAWVDGEWVEESKEPIPQTASVGVPFDPLAELKHLDSNNFAIFVQSVERIASSLETIAKLYLAEVKLQQLRYAKDFPQVERQPATVGTADYRRADPVQVAEEEGQDLFDEEKINYVGPREARLQGLREKQKRRNPSTP